MTENMTPNINSKWAHKALDYLAKNTLQKQWWGQTSVKTELLEDWAGISRVPSIWYIDKKEREVWHAGQLYFLNWFSCQYSSPLTPLSQCVTILWTTLGPKPTVQTFSANHWTMVLRWWLALIVSRQAPTLFKVRHAMTWLCLASEAPGPTAKSWMVCQESGSRAEARESRDKVSRDRS